MSPMSQIDIQARELGIYPVIYVRKVLREQGSIFRAAIYLNSTPSALRSWAKTRGFEFAVKTIRTADLVPMRRAK